MHCFFFPCRTRELNNIKTRAKRSWITNRLREESPTKTQGEEVYVAKGKVEEAEIQLCWQTPIKKKKRKKKGDENKIINKS